MTLKCVVRRFVRRTGGVDLIEYALLGAFVAVAVNAGVNALGDSLDGFYTGVFDSIGVMSAAAPEGVSGGGGAGGGGTGGGSTGGGSTGGGTTGGGTGGGGNGNGNGGGGGGGNGGGGNGGGNGNGAGNTK
jgi:Flp pilus assembly pilin Flp